MGQKITEHPQVDYWLKLTREADKAGATLPHRDSADRKELSQYAEMDRARSRSAYSVLLPPGMLKAHIDPDETTKAEAEAEEDDEVAADDAPGASGDDEEGAENGEAKDV